VLNLMPASWKVFSHEETKNVCNNWRVAWRHHCQSAARSLREGVAETFSVQKLQILASRHKCLATTNIIERHQPALLMATDIKQTAFQR